MQDLKIAGKDDSTVLDWAAQAERVLLTHDQRIIPGYVFKRIQENQAVAGVIVVKNKLSLRAAIEDILLIAEATSSTDWVNQVQHLPL